MDWTEFQQQSGGILVVGHGTRRPDGAAQLIELSERMRSLRPEIPLAASFLELAQPSIAMGLEQLAGFGVQHVFVIPILLFEAGHARSDIPNAVADAARRYAIKVVGQSQPLGTHASALQLSEKRFLESLRCSNRVGCLRAGGCEEREACWQRGLKRNSSASEVDFWSPTALAMVGRGTSDATALEAMRHFTDLRVERLPWKPAWSKTGFFAGGEPNVDQLLAEAAATSAEIIVVQPHLLFEGELMEQLRRKVSQLMTSDSSQRWLIPMPLGEDTALAQTFLDLATEQLATNSIFGPLI